MKGVSSVDDLLAMGADHEALTVDGKPLTSQQRGGKKGAPKLATVRTYPAWPCVVELPPSTNNLFINRGRKRVKSPNYRKWISRVLNTMRPYAQPVTYPVSITFIVREKMNSQSDISNRIKATEDAMRTAGIIHNDNVKHVTDVRIQYRPVEGGRGVEIWVRPDELPVTA